MTPAEETKRLEEGTKRIQEFVIGIDKEPHNICQPLLNEVIEYATEIRNMREKDMTDASFNPPESGRILPFKKTAVS